MVQEGTFRSIWGPRLLSILRIVTGLLFLLHGSQKLFGFPIATPQPIPAFSLPWFAGIIEFFGGVLVAIGLLTRPVAFLLSGEMATAYFMAHAPSSFFPLVNHGELAVFYCFVFLYFAVEGGGVWSVDHALRSRSAT